MDCEAGGSVVGGARLATSAVAVACVFLEDVEPQSFIVVLILLVGRTLHLVAAVQFQILVYNDIIS